METDAALEPFTLPAKSRSVPSGSSRPSQSNLPLMKRTISRLPAASARTSTKGRPVFDRAGRMPIDQRRQDHLGVGRRLGRAGDRQAGGIAFGQVEQQVDHPVAAHRLGQALGDLRSDARQAGKRRHQRGQTGLPEDFFHSRHAELPMRLPRRADRIPMRLYMPAPRRIDDMSPDPSAADPTQPDPPDSTRDGGACCSAPRHRGTYENDLMIGGFVQRLAGRLLPMPSWMTLEAVLEYPDVDLADWLTGRRADPARRPQPACWTA